MREPRDEPCPPEQLHSRCGHRARVLRVTCAALPRHARRTNPRNFFRTLHGRTRARPATPAVFHSAHARRSLCRHFSYPYPRAPVAGVECFLILASSERRHVESVLARRAVCAAHVRKKSRVRRAGHLDAGSGHRRNHCHLQRRVRRGSSSNALFRTGAAGGHLPKLPGNSGDERQFPKLFRLASAGSVFYQHGRRHALEHDSYRSGRCRARLVGTRHSRPIQHFWDAADSRPRVHL